MRGAKDKNGKINQKSQKKNPLKGRTRPREKGRILLNHSTSSELFAGLDYKIGVREICPNRNGKRCRARKGEKMGRIYCRSSKEEPPLRVQGERREGGADEQMFKIRVFLLKKKREKRGGRRFSSSHL